jgi:hypothetical protein
VGFHFRPAITSEAKPLIGLYSESGCGKTKSALLLAKGFAGDMSKVGMIETESGRGEVYADDPVVGGYKVLPIRDNFSPKVYGEAITEAGGAGLQVLIVDSGSHEWESSGGVLDMAAHNEAEGKKGVLVWQQPKILHAREFVLKLLSTSVPLVILCMRAKYPMKQIIKEGGKKDWVRAEVVEPKQSEDILFEMMVHGWIDHEHRLHVTKWTKESFKTVFVDNEPITVDTGKRLAEWAKGATKKADGEPPKKEPPNPSGENGVLKTRDELIKEINRLKDTINPADYRDYYNSRKLNVNTATIQELQDFIEGLKKAKEQKGGLI